MTLPSSHTPCRRSLPLVSHRWHDLYFSEPRLWSPFVVSRASMAQRPEAEWQGWLARRAALAQRVSQHVARLEWRAADEGEPYIEGPSATTFLGGLPGFLEALQPNRLAELDVWSLWELPQPAAAALAHLTGVTHLGLNGCEPEVAAVVVNALRGGLLSVYCCPWRGDRLADAICSLPRLTHITVSTSTEGFQQPNVPLQQLTRLTQLRRLGIVCGHMSPHPVPVPEPASFASLDTCIINGLWSPLEVGGHPWEHALVWHLAPSTAGTLVMCISVVHRKAAASQQRVQLYKAGPLQVAGAHVKKIEMRRVPFACMDGSISGLLQTLELESIQQLPSLGRLLEALLPPAAPPLERLIFLNGALDARSLGNCPQLHHLQELHLLGVQGSDGIGAELAALLRQTPHLAELQVVARLQPGPRGSLPAALTWDSVRPHLSACTQLTRLVLIGQLVLDLPDGDYLASEGGHKRPCGPC